MKISNAFVGLNLAELFPDSAVKAKNLGIHIADFHAQRDDARQARRQAAPDDSHYAKLLTRFDEILSELTRLRTDLVGLEEPLSTQVKKAKKLANRLHKCINELDRIEKEIPFGEKCHSLIFAISHIVIRELESLSASQPMNAYNYLTGKCRHFWLTTTTQSLCTGLNRNSLTFDQLEASAAEKRENKRFQGKVSSFRGVGGFYASLEKSGFILDKVVDGTKVRLKVNLDWIFGWSLNILQSPSVIAEMVAVETVENSVHTVEPFFGEFSRENFTGFSQIDKSKETEYNESGLASPEKVSPTIVGENVKESEEKETAPAENQSTGPEIFAQNEEILALEVATDSAIRVMKLIFNQNNLQNGKIRHNTTNQVTEITKQDALDMRYWMLNTMRAIKREGETWTDVATIVNEAISNTAKYLVDHPTRWIYHPKFYLNPNFSVGTLKYYIETFLHPRVETGNVPSESVPLSQFTPQIQWLIENGGNRHTVQNYIRKLGSEAVTAAITFAGARIAGGFVPLRGKVNYIFGILKNLDPRLIGAQAELEKEKLFVKRAAKEAENSDAWTAAKVETIVRSMVRKSDELSRCNRAVCAKIADRANAQTANKAQVEMWVSGVAKGTSTLFAA